MDTEYALTKMYIFRSPIDASLGPLGTDYSFLLELMEHERPKTAGNEQEEVNNFLNTILLLRKILPWPPCR